MNNPKTRARFEVEILMFNLCSIEEVDLEDDKPRINYDCDFSVFNHLIGNSGRAFAYITESQKVVVISSNFSDRRTVVLDKVVSLCSVVGSTDFNFAALTSEGRLFFIPPETLPSINFFVLNLIQQRHYFRPFGTSWSFIK
jgi:hypothetical protein